LFHTDDSHFETPIIISPQGNDNSYLLGNRNEQQSRMTLNTSAPTKQSYQQNGRCYGQSKEPFSVHYSQAPTGNNHNLINGSVGISSRYAPPSQYVAPQPSMPPYGQHIKKWLPSQMQLCNHVYNGNLFKAPRPAVQNKISASKSLPSSKIPNNSPILWELSQEVREWKFLGRYLDLDEETIDEIDYNTVPNRTRDKSLKVLTEWVNSSTPTWEGLGEALLDAEYVMLYEKLLELIKKYALG